MLHRFVFLLSLSLGSLSLGCAVNSAGAAAGETADARTSAPLLRPLVETPCKAENEETASVRRAIDHVRAMTALPALRCDERSAAAATAHCGYVSVNRVLSHVEERGKPGFYGERFMDRMGRAHADDAPAAEVLADARSTDAVDSWINSVYHRTPFLRREVTSFGYGASESCSVIDFGKGRVAAGPAAVWPPNGAHGVPTTFVAKNEAPNPVPGHDIVGSPISVIGSTALVGAEAHLQGPSGAIAVKLITHESDATGLVHVGEAHIVPLAPLAAETAYTATLTARGVRYVTTFTTGSR